jgi:uncharacterized protein (TIGR02246 family)
MSDTRWAVRAALVAAAVSCGGPTAPAAQAPMAAPPEPVAIAPAPAPAPEPADDAAAPTPSLQTLMQATMKGMADALGSRDPQKVAALFGDDASAVAYGSWEAHGREAIAARLRDFFAAFGDARFVVLRAWTKGNAVIEESAWAGTMTGDFMGHRASHAPAGQLRAEVLLFDTDGRVKELHEYADDAGLVAQLSGKKDAPAVPLLPTNEPVVHASSDSPDEDKLATWGQAPDEALGKGDATAVVDGLAEDADAWVSFGRKPATRGRKALAKEIAGWRKAFPDQKWTTTAAWGIDGFAILEHEMTGTQKGPVGSTKATNKPVTDWHWLTIVQPNADAAAHHVWAYANLFELFRQTGALETTARRPPSAPRAAPKVAPAPTTGH